MRLPSYTGQPASAAERASAFTSLGKHDPPYDLDFQAELRNPSFKQRQQSPNRVINDFLRRSLDLLRLARGQVHHPHLVHKSNALRFATRATQRNSEARKAREVTAITKPPGRLAERCPIGPDPQAVAPSGRTGQSSRPICGDASAPE